jgi:tetratricopeptide (TPR) repeat protein
MYVRRNYREPFFREKKKGKNWLRRLFFFLLALAILIAIGIWQQEMVMDVAYEYLGPEMTATPQPEQLAQEARDLFWLGDMRGALAIWEEVISLQSDNIGYLYDYGMLLIDMDDGRNAYAQEAEALGQEIQDIDFNDPRGYALKARALLWQGSNSLAIQVAQTGLDIAPEFSPLHAVLSRAYVNEGDLRRGQEEGVLAIEYAPTDVRASWAYASSLANSGAREAAIEEYERAVSLHPGFLPPYFELAGQYLASNRDQAAIDIYNQIRVVQPRNARALLRLCETYRKVGQFEQSRGLCEDAVQADPSFVPAQFQLGSLMYNDRNFERAYESFQVCLDLDPDNLDCTIYLGLTHYYLAQTEYQNVCAPQRLTTLDCGAVEVCQVGWDLLEEALLMAQARLDAQADESIISEGLIAISSDPACTGISGRLPSSFVAELAPEATEETDG